MVGKTSEATQRCIDASEHGVSRLSYETAERLRAWWERNYDDHASGGGPHTEHEWFLHHAIYSASPKAFVLPDVNTIKDRLANARTSISENMQDELSGIFGEFGEGNEVSPTQLFMIVRLGLDLHLNDLYPDLEGEERDFSLRRLAVGTMLDITNMDPAVQAGLDTNEVLRTRSQFNNDPILSF